MANLDDVFLARLGDVRFSRASMAWHAEGRLWAHADEPCMAVTEAGPAVYLGRRTRNLLPPEFAPLKAMPGAWTGDKRLTLTDGGELHVDASAGPVVMALPPQRLDPMAELLPEGQEYVGVLYQFSIHARGHGLLTIRLAEPVRDRYTEQPTVLTEGVQRPCVALDGLLQARELQITVTVSDGTVRLFGLMLEPYITTHRSCDRAGLFPCPGQWVPGGQSRDRDRLSMQVPQGTLPCAGMIDFWMKPAWHAAHPHHIFFEMAHWYFSFEAGCQAPLLYAGEKPCSWDWYWEWCTGLGFNAGTWHHWAATWNESGAVTMYLDGQSRSHVRQVPAHALDIRRVGEYLAIGGPKGSGWQTDPNVAGELEGHLRAWRLTPGHKTAADVLLAMEATATDTESRAVPAQAVFVREQPSTRIAIGESYCWFANQMAGAGDRIEVAYSTYDDHHPGPHLRPARDGRGMVVSEDAGQTWQRQPPSSWAVPFRSLPDGRRVYLKHVFIPDPPPFTLRLVAPNGHTEEITSSVDMGTFNGGRIPYAPTCLLPLRDGGYLLFAYSAWPNEPKSSVTVLASDDLRHWRAVAAPMRWDGRTEEGYNETAAVQLPNNRIMILTRTGSFQALVKCFSDDRGCSWTPPQSSGVCGVSPTLSMTADGALFLSTGRPGIVLAASVDGGETFTQCVTAEDDRTHEHVAFFGWYGYSSMNNGFWVDEARQRAWLSYDLLGLRLPDDGASRNACFVRPYDYRVIRNYRDLVRACWGSEEPRLQWTGHWQRTPGRCALTQEGGAALSGTFEGRGLVALLETSPNAGVVTVQIDEIPAQRISLYYPRRLIQRKLLALDLQAGMHRFRLALESGRDAEHKFADAEMPKLGGLQTVHLAGVTDSRRLVVYGLEVLTGNPDVHSANGGKPSP